MIDWMNPDDLRPIYDAQLKKMLAYIAADLSSLLIQFQIFLNLVGRPAWEQLSTAQACYLKVWIIGSWIVGVAGSIAIITKFHELVFLESKIGTWRFYNLFAPKRSRTAVVWDILFKGTLGTKDKDNVESDKLWDDPRRVSRMKNGIDAVNVLCIAISIGLLWINLHLLA